MSPLTRASTSRELEQLENTLRLKSAGSATRTLLLRQFVETAAQGTCPTKHTPRARTHICATKQLSLAAMHELVCVCELRAADAGILRMAWWRWRAALEEDATMPKPSVAAVAAVIDAEDVRTLLREQSKLLGTLMAENERLQREVAQGKKERENLLMEMAMTSQSRGAELAAALRETAGPALLYARNAVHLVLP
jgi:hypothetical protein